VLGQIPGGFRVTVGADKAYDTADFVAWSDGLSM